MYQTWVLGPGRCGSSLIMQVFRALGFDLGENQGEPYFTELDTLIHLNGNILRAMYGNPCIPLPFTSGTHEDKVHPGFGEPMPPRWWEKIPDLVEQFKQDIKDFSATAPQVLKDPRWGHTIAVWLECCQRPEYVVHLTRDVEKCAESCFKWCQKGIEESRVIVTPEQGEGPPIEIKMGHQPVFERVRQAVMDRMAITATAVEWLKEAGTIVFPYTFPDFLNESERDKLVAMFKEMKPSLVEGDIRLVLEKCFMREKVSDWTEKK